MVGFHALLGAAVVLLNLIVGIRGFVIEKSDESQQALAGFAHGALALQILAGFMLFTADTKGPGFVHYALPIAALVAVLAARAVPQPAKTKAVAGASIFAALAAAAAYATGAAKG